MHVDMDVYVDEVDADVDDDVKDTCSASRRG